MKRNFLRNSTIDIEPILFGFILFLFLIIITFQIVRPTPINKASAIKNEYENGNHELYVYYVDSVFNLRNSADFRITAKNIANQLQKGTLFFLTDTNVGMQHIETINKPHNNVTKYEFHKVYKLDKGDYKPYFARLNMRMYIGDTIIHNEGGYFGRSASLIEYIRHTLKENNCDFKDVCIYENFAYGGNGLYGTTLLSDTAYYNRKGERIGTLPAGTRVYGSYNLPFAVGYNNPTLFRFVGYQMKGEEIALGTFFADIFESDERYTIATMPKS